MMRNIYAPGYKCLPPWRQVFLRRPTRQLTPATGLVYQDYIIAGGTGKFEGATGNNRLTFTRRDCTAFPVCILEGFLTAP